MLSVSFLLVVLFSVFAILCMGSATEKQLLRNSHSSSHKVALPNNGKPYQSTPKFTTVKKESIAPNSFNIVSPFGAERGMSLLKSMANTVKDEILDCVDSLVYAESNAERLDNLLDMGYRYRPVLLGGAALALGKVAFAKSQAMTAAAKMQNELRMAQVAKWGKRRF